jgi:UDP-glucose 4-epimerase
VPRSPVQPALSSQLWSTISLPIGHRVVGVDNVWSGVAGSLEHAYRYDGQHPRQFTLVRADIQGPELIDIVAGTNRRAIFHFAAQVDVCTSASDPQFDARSNVLGTINLCEASQQADVQRIAYAALETSRYGHGHPSR